MILKMYSIIIDLSLPRTKLQAKVLCTKLVIYLFIFLIRATATRRPIDGRTNRRTDSRTIEIGLQRMLIFFLFTFHHNSCFFFIFSCRLICQVAIFVIVAAFVNLIN